MGRAGGSGGCERDAAQLERGAGPWRRGRRHGMLPAALGPAGRP